MSKALVIKGANFALNKLTTVTLDDIVPCTGITLSDSTFVATAIGATKTLTATVVPSDTTEQVTWTSSNSNVATVTNGLVTIVGVGTATITATCGSQSATCSVSATVTMNLSSMTCGNGFGVTSTNLEQGKDYINANVNKPRQRTYYSPTNTLNGYELFVTLTTDYDGMYPIPLPPNASHAVLSVDSNWSLRNIVFANANEKYTASLSNVRDACRAYSNIITASSVDLVTDIPAGANSFAIALMTASSSKNADAISSIEGSIVFS